MALETIRAVREIQAETLLAFSTGKDAIAAWLAVREHFDRVHPYYLYLIPGLEFVEESLDYYEGFFGERIARLPHPSLHRWLNNLVFQPPERCAVIEQAGLPNHSYVDACRVLCEDKGLPNLLAADGVRAADSPMRRIAISRHGPISKRSSRYHPIWDLVKTDLVDLFRKSGARLPVDYRIWGRSFDGIDARFLVPMKRHLPRDYRRVLEWFPLAEMEVYRWERAHG